MSNNENRTIVHMDLDSFFVSVELLKNPSLRGIPLIIGGSSERGVVASCSYEARKFGIHSAMPAKLARRLCPQALWLKGDMESYSKYSSLVTSVIEDNAPVFEKSSIDEFYLDVTGLDRFFGCWKWTNELKAKVMKETGLPISFGLSENKTISKMATNESKPNGQMQIPLGDEKKFIYPLPVQKIPHIGEKTGQVLKQMGIVKVETLATMPLKLIQNTFGKFGIVMWQRANGIDQSPVVPYSERKSISTETTFTEDTIDVKMLREKIIKMVEEIAYGLRSQNFLTGCVTVKIKYSNFDTYTKQATISYTSIDSDLHQKALELFDKLYERRMLIRLVGVRFSNLVHGNYQISIFDNIEKKIHLYQALDNIRNKHGESKIGRAL